MILTGKYFLKFWEEKKRHNRCPWTVFHWNCWRKWENKRKWEINKLLNFNFSNIENKEKKNGDRDNSFSIFTFINQIIFYWIYSKFSICDRSMTRNFQAIVIFFSLLYVFFYFLFSVFFFHPLFHLVVRIIRRNYML